MSERERENPDVIDRVPKQKFININETSKGKLKKSRITCFFRSLTTNGLITVFVIFF